MSRAPDGGDLAIPQLALRSRGLVVVGVDSGVGKTVSACLIADQLSRRGIRVGPCKPIATGCRTSREGLVSQDAESFAYAAQFDPNVGTLDAVNPVRFKQPGPPALALERRAGSPTAEQDYSIIGRSLRRLDEACDALVVEAPGGMLTPLDRKHRTLDFLITLDLPLVLVAVPEYRMLNLVGQACHLARQCRLRLAGLVVNCYDHDHPGTKMQDVVRWMGQHNKIDILATLPRVEAFNVVHVDPDLQSAIDVTDFLRLWSAPRWQ